ncbi:MAG TPA: hypothetical protein PLA83_10415 [Deltaproteobacteria bacterium]|nr:hypothetical protein [Deltaproteobacteria bacterium]HQI02603.1 hypothetical protein [Deltaproteobacteria bacterium]HQJ09796.1 hypothetical protein [Deltaproteobacteria bacterium]
MSRDRLYQAEIRFGRAWIAPRRSSSKEAGSQATCRTSIRQ